MTRDGFGYVDNLGPEINTSGDEMFPSFAPDGTLYFSSTGHPGMGGLDIFRAVPDSLTGRWHIENMKSPVNSQSDDFGMTFEPGAHNLTEIKHSLCQLVNVSLIISQLANHTQK